MTPVSHSASRGFCALILIVSLGGCSPMWKQMTAGTARHEGPPDLTAWLASHEITPNQNLRVDELGRNAVSSMHVVQLRGREPLHIHERHDLEAMIHRGHGTMILGTQEIDVKPGSLMSVPRGTPHAFINRDIQPAVAFSEFKPPFDGIDTIAVPE